MSNAVEDQEFARPASLAERATFEGAGAGSFLGGFQEKSRGLRAEDGSAAAPQGRLAGTGPGAARCPSGDRACGCFRRSRLRVLVEAVPVRREASWATTTSCTRCGLSLGGKNAVRQTRPYRPPFPY